MVNFVLLCPITFSKHVHFLGWRLFARVFRRGSFTYSVFLKSNHRFEKGRILPVLCRLLKNACSTVCSLMCPFMHPFRDILFFSAGALERYVVSFPPRWKELPVSNAKSGNYCQPRCDEVNFELASTKPYLKVELQATTEVVFSDPTQGTLQIVIIPTTKLLISKKFPSMKDVGSIKNVIDAISPAITGRCFNIIKQNAN